MIAKVTIIQCDKCHVQKMFHTTDTAVAILRAYHIGWHITEDQHLCWRCAHDNVKADNDLV